jgi:3-phosphoshikimate 1-carboxyvinyltransferase
VASAQVKSAILFAGIQAGGTTSVVEATPTRDHTERILSAMGVDVRVDSADGVTRIAVQRSSLDPLDLLVPGDFSSAAPLLVAAALIGGSELSVRGVGLNPTRTGLLRVLERMGSDVTAEVTAAGAEPSGEVRVRQRPMEGTRIGPEEVPGLIDELPLVGVLATQADGTTEVRGAAELRLKESDRIAGLVDGLRALGARAEPLEDGFVIHGPTPLRGGRCDARDDHRLAMAFAVAALIASGPVEVKGMGFVGDSFPGFAESLAEVR